MNNTCILIPSYKPTEQLVQLVQQLRQNYSGLIAVVDDGNGSKGTKIFNQLIEQYNVHFYRHFSNLGKGRALKTGFNSILIDFPNCEWIVTADSDGQHQVKDILKVLESTQINSASKIVFGCRQFKGNVPLRSRFGNILTKYIFRFFVGLKIQDTQTGLRAYNRKILPSLIATTGEGFEYETNILIEVKRNSWAIHQVEIETIYLENNKNSHFIPLYDSMRIYFIILRFLSSSMLSSLIDVVCFAFFTSLGIRIYQSNLMARFVSGWFNFFVNKNLVFKQKTQLLPSMIRYWALAFAMGTLSSFIINGLLHFWNQPIVIKIIAESVLFFASYSIQQQFIFKPKEDHST